MVILLGSIADDYTGASDLANTLTKNGLRTVQTVGIPDPSLALPDVDAVVVSLKIRSVPASDAVAAAASAERWLRQRGAGHVLYKICSTFDSTDAGNIGPVTEALSDAAGGGIVLVTPAFPETGRTVYLGHLFVGGQPLNESPLKDHPLNPMHDANLVRVLTRQSRNVVGLIDLTTIAAGPGAVKARLDPFALQASPLLSPMRFSNAILKRSARSLWKRQCPPVRPASASALPVRSSAPVGYPPAVQRRRTPFAPWAGFQRSLPAAVPRRRSISSTSPNGRCPSCGSTRSSCLPVRMRSPRRFLGWRPHLRRPRRGCRECRA